VWVRAATDAVAEPTGSVDPGESSTRREDAMTRVKRLTAVIVFGLLALGLVAPAASAQSCVAQQVEFERDEFGTGFGKDFVSVGARNPEMFGESNFGRVVSFFATSSPDACPGE
jgi:hypothetical protein